VGREIVGEGELAGGMSYTLEGDTPPLRYDHCRSSLGLLFAQFVGIGTRQHIIDVVHHRYVLNVDVLRCRTIAPWITGAANSAGKAFRWQISICARLYIVNVVSYNTGSNAIFTPSMVRLAFIKLADHFISRNESRYRLIVLSHSRPISITGNTKYWPWMELIPVWTDLLAHLHATNLQVLSFCLWSIYTNELHTNPATISLLKQELPEQQPSNPTHSSNRGHKVFPGFFMSGGVVRVVFVRTAIRDWSIYVALYHRWNS